MKTSIFKSKLKINNYLVLIITTIAVSFNLSSQNNFTIEQVMSPSFPSHLTVSNSDNLVAWVQNKEGIRNIYVSDGKTKAKKITNYTEDDGQEISNLIFNKNNSLLIFVRGGAPNRRGEIPNPLSLPNKVKREIWKVSLADKKIDRITEGYSPTLSYNGSYMAFLKSGQVWFKDINKTEKPKSLFSIRGSAGSLNWSPNSNKLAFVSNRSDHSFIGVFDLKTKKITYLSPSIDYDTNPVWSQDSKRLAYLKFPREIQALPFFPKRSALPWSIYVADTGTGDAKEIWKAPEGIGSAFRSISASRQLFWSDNEQLVFPWEGDGFTNLYTIRTDGTQLKLLSPGKSEVQFVSMSPNNKSIIFSSNKNDIDRQHIWRTNLKDYKTIQLTKGEGIQWAPVLTVDNKLFMLASGPTSSAFPAVLEKGKIKSLQSKKDLIKFPKNNLVKPEQVIFSAADGMKIHGQLFLPPNMKKGEKHPALLFFHGGSRRQMLLGFHHRGYYHNAYSFNQFLANQGYIVLSVNYRSGIGYGMEFREALNYGARGASEFQDVLGAGLYLRNRLDVNPDKIGLWGGSYGGFLTAMGLAKASDLFAAGVDIHGVHDWNFVIKNFRQNYNPAENQKVAKLAFNSSPAAYVKDWKSPVLLIHGDDDRNVPFSETVNIIEALRRNNVEFEQLIFPDEVHGFLLHKSWVRAYHATFDFFERKLKN